MIRSAASCLPFIFILTLTVASPSTCPHGFVEDAFQRQVAEISRPPGHSVGVVNASVDPELLLEAFSNDSVVESKVFMEVCDKLTVDFDDGEETLRERRIVNLLLGAAPPFAIGADVEGVSEQCVNDTKLFLEELNRLTLWAVKMHDSTAKFPSGWLNGNVNQFGDFDQCLSIASPPQGQPQGQPQVRGQYCLANVDLRLADDADGGRLDALHRLAQSHRTFRSTPDDPGHRVPRFSAIQWALCVPASCNAGAVQRELLRRVEEALESTGFSARVTLAGEMCQVAGGGKASRAVVAVGLFFLAILALVVISTATDDSGVAPSLLRCFSLRRNLVQLLDTAPARDDITAVHGLRALNAAMLIICHKSMALFFNPYINRTAMAETMGQSWTVIGRAASLYTDPFVMFSGLLTSYAYFRHLDARGAIDVRHEFASRMFRLVPNLVAVILFCTFLLPWMGSGPQWNLVVTHHAELCQQHWWRNLLFIHNYFGFENMCLTHTHHLGIDTQLFMLAPALAFALWRWPRGGAATLLALAVGSTWLRYSITVAKQLSLFIYFGSPLSQMFRSADLSYILPSHRLTVYIMGIFLGAALRHCGRRFALKKLHLAAGWSMAAVLFYVSLFGPARMGHRDYVYDVNDAANYTAFAPIIWCIVFAWVVFASHTGNGGLVGKAMSWPGFKVATRLSYAVYLTQFPIFFYNVGRTRSAELYSTAMLVNIPELMFIFLASTVLTLMFDLPFQNMRKMLLTNGSKPSTHLKPAAVQSQIKSE